jgi:hypothetical protein
MELDQASKRIETLLDRFSAFPATTGARADAEELVRITSSLHGECLRRIVHRLREELGPRADLLLEHACSDPLIASLLVTHGLHPVPLEDRVRRAVEQFDDVQLLGVTEDLVEIRVDGTADTAEKAEQAIHAAAPEVLEVRSVGQTISLLNVV